MSARLEACGHQIIHLYLENETSQSARPVNSQHNLPPSYGLIAGQTLRRKLRGILLQARPDLIHVHECFTTLSSVLLTVMRDFAPLVGTLHDVRPFCYLMTRRFTPTGEICLRQCGASCFSSGCIRPDGLADAVRLARRWMMDRLSLNVWRRLDRVIVPSTYMYDLALQHGILPKHLRLVPHGTAVSPSPPSAESRTEPALLLYVGSLLEYKGPGILVEALSFIREQHWHAVLVGEGPLRQSLEEAVKRLHLSDRVSFYGHVSDGNEVRKLLGNARLLVVPSLIPESFSLAGIEALAMATPVVSFGLGGISEWFRDGENGLLSRLGDATDLARQISRLIADREMAMKLGKKGHALIAQNFSTEKSLNGLLAVYGELLGLTQHGA